MTIREAIEILELETPVSHEQVKRSFRQKAKKYHPDRHKDEISSKLNADRFIQARAASDLLLSYSEAIINSPGRQRDPARVVRREPRRQPPPHPVTQIRFVKELDNMIRLFRMIQGSTKKFKSINLNIQPGAWLGKMYEFLFEKKFSGEDFLKGNAFAFYRFFRLFFGSIFLIAGFIGISIIGMILAAGVFPALIVFQAVYTIYIQMIDFQAKKLNLHIKVKDKEKWVSIRRKYLHFRTVPVFGMLILASMFIRLSAPYSGYFTLLSLMFCIPLFILMLSVSYEWLHYYKLLRAE